MTNRIGIEWLLTVFIPLGHGHCPQFIIDKVEDLSQWEIHHLPLEWWGITQLPLCKLA